MVYASDLARGKAAAGDLIDTHDPSTLTGAQILVDRTTARDGWGVDCLRAALEALEAGAAGARPEWRNIRAIDLNFGCPDPAVSARGAGPAQLRRRSKVQAIFAALAAWRERTSLPIGAIGAKIRLGNTAREQQYQVYLPVAEAAVGSLDYLVVRAIPAPVETPLGGGLRALIVDSWFDNYLGIVSLIRVVAGTVSAGDRIYAHTVGKVHIVDEVGVFTPKRQKTAE